MNLPKPNFTNNASTAEIKRYLVMVVEEIEKTLTKMEDAISGDEN